MPSMSDRFRNWYDHERDCNAKILKMLDSVPEDKRGTPEFRRAIDLMVHMILARRMWLFRLGGWKSDPGGWDKEDITLQDLPGLIAETESAWVTYLKGANDDGIARDLTWKGFDDQYRRWPIENILAQVSGHAWYHRGQIVELVRILGGKPESTDYIFWNRPEIVVPPTAVGT